MFELAWSKVLIIAIATIVVVGPKDLPMVLRTIGRYLGYLRRQADEFKQQFEEAIREAELDSVKKEFEDVKKATENTLRGIEENVGETVKSASIVEDIERAGTTSSSSEIAGTTTETAPAISAPVPDTPLHDELPADAGANGPAGTSGDPAHETGNGASRADAAPRPHSENAGAARP